MTLDFKKMIKNALVKQMTIQHVEIPDRSVQIFKKEELITCPKITQKLQSLYGDSFMLDADFWIFFSSQGSDLQFDKEFVEKTLFKVVNLALGESANSMNASDLKLFSFGDGDSAPVPEKTTDQTDLSKDDADDANEKAIGDALGGDESDGDVRDALDESAEEPSDGEKFVFLKITMK